MAVEADLVNSSWVQGGIGIAVAIISGVCLKLGWAKGKDTQPETQVEMAGAIVDSRAVKTLIDALDFAVDRVTDLHDMRMRHDKKALEESDGLREDIKELTKTLKAWVQKESSNGR